MSSSVRPSSVCLSSITFVRPIQAIEIFGNVSTPFGTLATRWHPDKISLKSLKKCIPTLRANIGPIIRHISQTIHIYYAHTESSNPRRHRLSRVGYYNWVLRRITALYKLTYYYYFIINRPRLPTNHRLQLHHRRHPLPLYGTKCLNPENNSVGRSDCTP